MAPVADVSSEGGDFKEEADAMARSGAVTVADIYSASVARSGPCEATVGDAIEAAEDSGDDDDGDSVDRDSSHDAPRELAVLPGRLGLTIVMVPAVGAVVRAVDPACAFRDHIAVGDVVAEIDGRRVAALGDLLAGHDRVRRFRVVPAVPAVPRGSDSYAAPPTITVPLLDIDEAEGQGKPKAGDRSRTHLKQPFVRSDDCFLAFANMYVGKELHTCGVGPQVNPQWEDAKKEFYDGHPSWVDVPEATTKRFKKLFLASLKRRHSFISKEEQPESDDTEAQKMCRRIMKLQAEADVNRKREGEAKKGLKRKQAQEQKEIAKRKKDETKSAKIELKRKQAQEQREIAKREKEEMKRNGKRGRMGRADDDFDMSPALEELLASAERDMEEKKEAETELKTAEKELEEAKQRMARALDKKKASDEKTERSLNAFAEKGMQAPGKWTEMYDALTTYYQEYKSWYIRGEDRSALRKWVWRQRQRYHMDDCHRNKLPWYLARALETIHFPWDMSDDKWNKQYERLVEFKEERGHCRVPRSFEPSPTLARFVKCMRVQRKKFLDDPATSTITAEQIKLLDDIDFTWENRSRTWNERFEEFKQFTEQNGHGYVPKECPEYPKLPSWCQNQRAFHNAFLLGKRTFMNVERNQQLEDAGFRWDGAACAGTSPGRNRQRATHDESSSESEGGEVEPEPVAQHLYQRDPWIQEQINATLMQEQQQQQQRHY